MSDDLVNRLRSLALVEGEPTAKVLKEAADRIEQLEANLNTVIEDSDDTYGKLEKRIEELEAALRPFAALAAPLVDGRANYAIGLRDEHFENARTALEGKKDAVL